MIYREDYSFYKELYYQYHDDFPNLNVDEFINLVADLKNTKDSKYLSIYNLDEYQRSKIIEIVRDNFKLENKENKMIRRTNGIRLNESANTAREVFDLEIIEKRGMISLISDGQEEFWVRTLALNELVDEVDLDSNEGAEAYDRWCMSACVDKPSTIGENKMIRRTNGTRMESKEYIKEEKESITRFKVLEGAGAAVFGLKNGEKDDNDERGEIIFEEILNIEFNSVQKIFNILKENYGLSNRISDYGIDDDNKYLKRENNGIGSMILGGQVVGDEYYLISIGIEVVKYETLSWELAQSLGFIR